MKLARPMIVKSCALLSILFSLFLLKNSAHAEEERKPILTVLYSAEAHGALLPCDCPLQPLGGVARRASVIKTYRERGPVLLIDGGGWAAGGMYDEESDGDAARDRLRTELMASAMKAMNYDLVCADEAEGMYLRGSHKDSGIELSILPDHSGGKADERVVAVALRAGAGEKIHARQSRLPDAPAKVILPRVFISRLGEDESSQLAALQKEPAIILNAGRKSTQRISWRSGQSTLANFDFQAQRLCVIEIFAAANPAAPYEIRVLQEKLTREIRDDPQMSELLSPHLSVLKKKGKQRVPVEFWTMPECPGCIAAKPEIEQLNAALAGRLDLTLHFVVHKEEDGRLGSLHGEQELAETRLQILIQKYYPERIWEWLQWREQHRAAPWIEGAQKLGLLATRLRGALQAGEADVLLKADYELMQRRKIPGTPTLVIANRVYEGEDRYPHLLRALCSILSLPRPDACKEAPACFNDYQCRKRGFIGTCVDAGKPAARCDTSRLAVKIPAIVIVDRENIHDEHERMMEIVLGDLPGIEFTLLDISDARARALIESMKLTRLPAFLLDPVSRQESTFAESVGRVVTESKDDKGQPWLILKPYATGAHRVINRPRIKGRVDLFVSRFTKNGQEALETALEHAQSSRRSVELGIHDVLYFSSKTPRLELAASGGIAEVEEAARAMAVRKLAPEKLAAYLLLRGKRRGSSYWDAPLKESGVDPAAVRALAEPATDEIFKSLCAEAELLESLETRGEIVVLAENCEIVPVKSRNDLRHILERVGQKK